MIERSIASPYARTPQTNMNQVTLAKLSSPFCRIQPMSHNGMVRRLMRRYAKEFARPSNVSDCF
jgi:hypothetical protein